MKADDDDTEWMVFAACRTKPLDLFFPNDGPGVAEAVRVCAKCVVRGDCLEYAIEHRINQGVWGGASERERQRIIRRRRLANRAA